MNQHQHNGTVALVAITSLLEHLAEHNLINPATYLNQLGTAQVGLAMTGRLDDSRAIADYIAQIRQTFPDQT
ncbi:MAG TPA: hypothetical protein DCG63_03940 [Methylophilaceae bacterium]|nr:hypothetical protein [Methylophilaceae bacterium]